MSSLAFKPVPAFDLQNALDMEVVSFTAEEAATLQLLTYRQQNAPELFLGAYEGSKLVGYVCATLMDTPELTYESMSTHIPIGKYVGIHSVTVHPDYRKQGIALRLLGEYQKRLKGSGYKGVRLIAHDELVPFYEKAGFKNMGPSTVKFGSQPWFRIAYDLEA